MQHTFKALKKQRLSSFLSQNGVSRSLMCCLKQVEGGITVNGTPAHTDYMLSPGDIAAINEPIEHQTDIAPAEQPGASVLYEDSEVVVFDKPPFMPTHPSHKHSTDTLANHYAFITGGDVFRCINRLDRDTSGCCLIAKSRYCAGVIGEGLQKTYYAVCEGVPKQEGVIELPIGRKPGSIIERECTPGGQYARTEYRLIKTNGRYSLCEVTLKTGRTHQIRVHFSAIGHPLAGDDMYGGSLSDIDRQALHCGQLIFTSPDKGRVTVISELPKVMRALLND